MGSSSPYSSHPLLHAIHAEDMALNYIDSLRHKYYRKFNPNDVYIIIWKQNAKGDIRPVFCCDWCSKLLLKSSIPIKNIITISDDYDDCKTMDKCQMVQCAINYARAIPPLMKKDMLKL